ncbi:hypothetical protein LEJE111609_01785 [Lelliottia jeotgali]
MTMFKILMAIVCVVVVLLIVFAVWLDVLIDD